MCVVFLALAVLALVLSLTNSLAHAPFTISTWKARVYTQEQQERLGVTKNGEPNPPPNATATGTSPDKKKTLKCIGPKWTWDNTVEAPAGIEDMG